MQILRPGRATHFQFLSNIKVSVYMHGHSAKLITEQIVCEKMDEMTKDIRDAQMPPYDKTTGKNPVKSIILW